MILAGKIIQINRSYLKMNKTVLIVFSICLLSCKQKESTQISKPSDKVYKKTTSVIEVV